jgi:hypothetical protein
VESRAAIVTGLGNLPLLTTNYSPIKRVDCFLSPCSHPDNGSSYHDPYYRTYRYGYNGYTGRMAITAVIGLMVMVGAIRNPQA